MGYHIAGILSLHKHFSKQQDSPVPNFLVIDQPSQVYFPESWPTENDQIDRASNKELSQDIIGVQRIFKTLSLFIKTLEGRFQIIVTEHAGPITWKNQPYTHLVANWREGGDDFLIPNSWRKS